MYQPIDYDMTKLLIIFHPSAKININCLVFKYRCIFSILSTQFLSNSGYWIMSKAVWSVVCHIMQDLIKLNKWLMDKSGVSQLYIARL